MFAQNYEDCFSYCPPRCPPFLADDLQTEYALINRTSVNEQIGLEEPHGIFLVLKESLNLQLVSFTHALCPVHRIFFYLISSNHSQITTYIHATLMGME